MKITKIKVVCILLTACMLISISSCRGASKNKSGESSVVTDSNGSIVSQESSSVLTDSSGSVISGVVDSSGSLITSGSGAVSGSSSNILSSGTSSSRRSSAITSGTAASGIPALVKIELQTTPSGLKIPTKAAIGLKSKKLRYMHVGGGAAYAPEGVTYEALKKYYGVIIEPIHSTPETAALQLSQFIASDDSPDIIDGTGFFPAFPQQNLVQPIDGLINYDDVPIMKPYKEAYDSYVYNNLHWYIVSSSYMTSSVYYNTKMFKDAGLADPRELYEKNQWTWDVLLDSATKLKSIPNRRWGIFLCTYQSSRFVFTTGQNYVNMVNGKLVNNLNNAPFGRAFNFLNDLTLSYKVAPKDGRDISFVHANFDSGMSAMLMSAGWMATNGLYFPQLKKADTLGYVPMPRDPQNSKLYVPGTSFNRFVPVGAKNMDAVKAFIYADTLATIDSNNVGSESFEQNYQRTLKNSPGIPKAQFTKMAKYMDEYNNLPMIFDSYETILDVDDVYKKMVGEGGTTPMSFLQAVEDLNPEINNQIAIVNSGN